MDYTNNPNHWSNSFPWNRRGTVIRLALEQFLAMAARLPDVEQPGRKQALDWLRGLMDKKPGDLFP